MKSIFKKFTISLAFIFSAAVTFALPGINYSIKDISGQYVYYQDKSFERESYLGIIYYDDSTYGIRYYAPAFGQKKNFVPAKNISILFSLDETKNYVELTGERLTTAVGPEDTDLINYIHDFLYEMTARRQKAGEITKPAKINQLYEQFGGDVSMEYDPIVPITNLLKISNNGKTVLEIVTAGQLISSDDTSFTDFEGIPDSKTDKSAKLKLKKSKPAPYSFESEGNTFSINLDSNWTQQAENFWLLQSSAVLAINALGNIPEEALPSFKRRLLLGTDHTYPDWRQLSVTENENKTTIRLLFFNDLSGSFSNDVKILSKDKIYNLLTYTVYLNPYSANRKYFEEILKSYRVR
ncbi:MAG: hypothetical protein KBT11_05465 [Treponema sp.]|nr:hypothetical protein [Candidatus Treponema equifaecale]